MMQRGMRMPQQGRTRGLRDLLQQLRQQRRERLDRFDLGGVMDDIRNQIEEILEMERATLRDRLGEPPAEQSGGEQADDQQPAVEQASDEEPRGQHAGGQQAGGSDPTEEQQFQEMLERIAQRKQDFLDRLPRTPPGRSRSSRTTSSSTPRRSTASRSSSNSSARR